MQILNGKELEETPHMIISFGGGMGGFSYHYRYVHIKTIKDGVVDATGFAVRPQLLEATNIFACTDDMLYCFKMDNSSRDIRDEIRDLLLKGSVDKACRRFREHKGIPSDTTSAAIVVAKRQAIRSCGNWTYIGPDQTKVQEDYVICMEENFSNRPITNEIDDSDLSFKYLEDAREHLEEMVDSDGFYIIHRTEEIV